ncbi:lipase family protein [Sphaerisporangium sp. NPDC005289]|uniref:alpha/beta hydrolase family protein n=1 Tax=Sphaerisporangium sp. NPDC005289 TaxID=3155247 RepID=UPI00339FDBCC
MPILRTLTALASALVLLAGATSAHAAEAREGGGEWRGTPVRLEPLPEPSRLAGAGPSWSLRYLSTSWNGGPAVVGGTLSLPSGRPPSGGWPVVSFGHGFDGLGDACAPSRTGPSPWERAVQEALVAAGYAVAVTDGEGLGTPAESPGVDGASEAYNMIDIVRAARNIAPVSRSWVAAGYSLGGHAALFAAALAHRYAPTLRHAGTIALAPITQWGVQLASPAFRDPAAQLPFTVPYTGHTLALTEPGFRPSDWFTPAGLELVRLAGRACVQEMLGAAAGRTNGEVVKDPAALAEVMTRALADDEVIAARYPKPVYIAHGTADAGVPLALTELTVRQLSAAGTDVTFLPVPGADHITLLPAIARLVTGWTDSLLR